MCKRDGYYLEGRDYKIKKVLDSSTMLAQDMTTHTEFSISMVESDWSLPSHECHILSRLGEHRNVIHFLGGVIDEKVSPSGPVHMCRMMFEYTGGNNICTLNFTM